MDVLARNNVHVSGRGERAMMFAHGFGCDQNMWRFVASEFENDFKVVLFDHVGAGGSAVALPSHTAVLAALGSLSYTGTGRPLAV